MQDDMAVLILSSESFWVLLSMVGQSVKQAIANKVRWLVMMCLKNISFNIALTIIKFLLGQFCCWKTLIT